MLLTLNMAWWTKAGITLMEILSLPDLKTVQSGWFRGNQSILNYPHHTTAKDDSVLIDNRSTRHTRWPFESKYMSIKTLTASQTNTSNCRQNPFCWDNIMGSNKEGRCIAKVNTMTFWPTSMWVCYQSLMWTVELTVTRRGEERRGDGKHSR